MEEDATHMKKTGKVAYEEKRAQKLKERGREAKIGESSRRKGRLASYLIALIILALLGYGFYFLVKKELPEGEDRSREIPIQGEEHIAVGAEHESYNSNPPTSGPHYAEPARPGFRGSEIIADEHIVHSLEHGLIWISYRPEVGAEVIEVLKDFDTGLVVITEREANETDIALAAWGRLDTFDVGETLSEQDVQRIDDFIIRYVNKGPERIPPSQHGGI
jgi:hypothetical protein